MENTFFGNNTRFRRFRVQEFVVEFSAILLQMRSRRRKRVILAPGISGAYELPDSRGGTSGELKPGNLTPDPINGFLVERCVRVAQ